VSKFILRRPNFITTSVKAADLVNYVELASVYAYVQWLATGTMRTADLRNIQ